MEALTVIGVMTIILVMVSQIFAVSYDIFVKQSARTDNDTGAILATRVISDMTRGADEVLASQTINGTSYTTSSATLVLRMPTVDTSDNIVAGSYDYVAFFRDAVDNTKIDSDSQPATGSQRVPGKKLVTAYNQTLAFRYNNPDPTQANRVQVYIVNQQTTRGVTLVTRGWTAIFLRNK